MQAMVITESNILLRGYDEGEDVRVSYCLLDKGEQERWFSKWTAQHETTQQALTRAFERVANDLKTTLLPIVQ